MFFRTEDKKGGPTAIIFGFEDNYNQIFGTTNKYQTYENHPLYTILYNLHLSNLKELRYEEEHPGVTVFGRPPPGLPAKIEPTQIQLQPLPLLVSLPEVKETLSEEKKEPKPVECQKTREDKIEAESQEEVPDKFDEDEMARKRERKCDEIFGEFLDYVSKKVKKDFYKHLLLFMILFRDCMNSYQEKLGTMKEPPEVAPPDVKILAYTKPEPGKVGEYCSTNNAEQAPDISNDFVTSYLIESQVKFERLDAIELTQNFCHWLFINGYTCSKLSLIQESS